MRPAPCGRSWPPTPSIPWPRRRLRGWPRRAPRRVPRPGSTWCSRPASPPSGRSRSRPRPRSIEPPLAAALARAGAISMVRPLSSGNGLDQKPPSLDAIRARIDALDAEILRLVDERAGLARSVAAAKRAAGDTGFGLRPVREAQLIRRLLATPREGAGAGLTVRLWRELISDNLAQQGPFHISVWGGSDPVRATELARQRFGSAPPLRQAAKPEDALAQAKTPWGVAVLALAPDSAWWGRLLAEPTLSVVAAMPCLAAWGPPGALAVAELPAEPTGADETYWVTDAE